MTALTRKGVTLSTEAQEAAARAPLGRVMLYAYELWHDGMTEPVRFVDDKAPLFATLEADAPRNAGEEVEFLACPLQMARPTESDEAATPQVSLGRPDVAGLLKAELDAVRGDVGTTWTLIERLYASDVLTAPALLPPLSYELVGIDIAGPAAQMSARYDDDANIAIPRVLFIRTQYPGLQR